MIRSATRYKLLKLYSRVLFSRDLARYVIINFFFATFQYKYFFVKFTRASEDIFHTDVYRYEIEAVVWKNVVWSASNNLITSSYAKTLFRGQRARRVSVT